MCFSSLAHVSLILWYIYGGILAISLTNMQLLLSYFLNDICTEQLYSSFSSLPPFVCTLRVSKLLCL